MIMIMSELTEDKSPVPSDLVEQEKETETGRSVVEISSEENREMSGLVKEESDQKVEDRNEKSVKIEMVSESEVIEMSPQLTEEGDQERKTGNEGLAVYDQGELQNIEDYYESLEDKAFFETLKLQKDNFFEFPVSEENPQSKENRTKKDAIIAKVTKISPIALALFFMRYVKVLKIHI